MAERGAAFPGQPRRRRSHRLTAAAVAALVAMSLFPIAGAAAASPKPSPSLDVLLAYPPSADFVADTESTGTPIGAFDLGTYVEFLQPADPPATKRTLHDDGFVAGYGKSWTSQASNVGLVELVVAFSGGRGARGWLEAAAADARSSEFFKSTIVVDGIGPYYGVRYANPSAPSFADVVSFVKGNDYFVVGLVSEADNIGDATITQSKHQYDFAAANSIRESDWPENARAPFGLQPGRLALTVLVAGLAMAAAVGVAVAFVVVVSARRRPAPPPPS